MSVLMQSCLSFLFFILSFQLLFDTQSLTKSTIRTSVVQVSSPQ